MRTIRTGLCAYYLYASRRAMNQAKRIAGQMVGAAIQSGALVKQPCERCGCKRKVEAHHPDYSKPLDVQWLCRVHHRRLHASLSIEQREFAATDSFVREKFQRLTNNTAALVNNTSEALTIQATLAVDRIVQEQGIPLRQLALRLGVSRQMATNWFGGGIRTLKALANLADALGHDVHIELRARPSVPKTEVAA